MIQPLTKPETNAEYHADKEFIGSTMFRDFIDSPFDFYHTHYTGMIQKKVSKDLRFGNLFHIAIGEPENLAANFVTMPAFEFDADNRTGTGKPSVSTATDWYRNRVKQFASENEGKEIIEKDEYDQIQRMIDAVYSHGEARRIMEAAGTYEAPHRWDKRIKKRMRLDKVIPSGRLIIDYKTCDDASLRGFEKSCLDHKYFIQDHWYREGELDLTGEEYRLFFIFVEKNGLHKVGIHECDDDWQRLAIQVTERYTDELIGRRKANQFNESWQSGINRAKMPTYAPSRFNQPEREEIEV